MRKDIGQEVISQARMQRKCTAIGGSGKLSKRAKAVEISKSEYCMVNVEKQRGFEE